MAAASYMECVCIYLWDLHGSNGVCVCMYEVFVTTRKEVVIVSGCVRSVVAGLVTYTLHELKLDYSLNSNLINPVGELWGMGLNCGNEGARTQLNYTSSYQNIDCSMVSPSKQT